MAVMTPGVPVSLLATAAYFTPHRDIHFNGEPVEILHQPAVHTDGDSLASWNRVRNVGLTARRPS